MRKTNRFFENSLVQTHLLRSFCCFNALRNVANYRVGHQQVRRGTASFLTRCTCSSWQECSCRRVTTFDNMEPVSLIHNLKKWSLVMWHMFTVKVYRSTAVNICSSQSFKLLNVNISFCVYCSIKLTVPNVTHKTHTKCNPKCHLFWEQKYLF